MAAILSFSVSWCEALGTRIVWGLRTWDCRDTLERSDQFPKQLRRCFNPRLHTSCLQNSKWPPRKTNSTRARTKNVSYHCNYVIYIHCLQLAIRIMSIMRIMRLFLVLKSLFTDNPPSPGKVAKKPGSTSPTLFEQWCGFFYVPAEEPVK